MLSNLEIIPWKKKNPRAVKLDEAAYRHGADMVRILCSDWLIHY